MFLPQATNAFRQNTPPPTQQDQPGTAAQTTTQPGSPDGTAADGATVNEQQGPVETPEQQALREELLAQDREKKIAPYRPQIEKYVNTISTINSALTRLDKAETKLGPAISNERGIFKKLLTYGHTLAGTEIGQAIEDVNSIVESSYALTAINNEGTSVTDTGIKHMAKGKTLDIATIDDIRQNLKEQKRIAENGLIRISDVTHVFNPGKAMSDKEFYDLYHSRKQETIESANRMMEEVGPTSFKLNPTPSTPEEADKNFKIISKDTAQVIKDTSGASPEQVQNAVIQKITGAASPQELTPEQIVTLARVKAEIERQAVEDPTNEVTALIAPIYDGIMYTMAEIPLPQTTAAALTMFAIKELQTAYKGFSKAREAGFDIKDSLKIGGGAAVEQVIHDKRQLEAVGVGRLATQVGKMSGVFGRSNSKKVNAKNIYASPRGGSSPAKIMEDASKETRRKELVDNPITQTSALEKLPVSAKKEPTGVKEIIRKKIKDSLLSRTEKEGPDANIGPKIDKIIGQYESSDALDILSKELGQPTGVISDTLQDIRQELLPWIKDSSNRIKITTKIRNTESGLDVQDTIHRLKEAGVKSSEVSEDMIQEILWKRLSPEEQKILEKISNAGTNIPTSPSKLVESTKNLFSDKGEKRIAERIIQEYPKIRNEIQKQLKN